MLILWSLVNQFLCLYDLYSNNYAICWINTSDLYSTTILVWQYVAVLHSWCEVKFLNNVINHLASVFSCKLTIFIVLQFCKWHDFCWKENKKCELSWVKVCMCICKCLYIWYFFKTCTLKSPWIAFLFLESFHFDFKMNTHKNIVNPKLYDSFWVIKRQSINFKAAILEFWGFLSH